MTSRRIALIKYLLSLIFAETAFLLGTAEITQQGKTERKDNGDDDEKKSWLIWSTISLTCFEGIKSNTCYSIHVDRVVPLLYKKNTLNQRLI